MKKHKLQTITWPPIGQINYRGCVVEKIIGGYKVLGKNVSTEQEVDELINQSLEYINKSIKKMGYNL